MKQLTVIFFLAAFNFFSLPERLSAQDVERIIQLDSVMVQAVKGGFNISDFIELVKNDSSFYMSFQNLHYYPFKFTTNLVAQNKKHKEKGTLYRKAVHQVQANKEWTEITEEKTTGLIYKKNKSFNYYTAELLDYTFFSKDTGNISNKVSGNNKQGKKTKQSNENYERLKVMMFNPGTEVEGVPLVGKKMAIFDPEMSQYYDYFINADVYQDSIKCYKFICRAKGNDTNRADNHTVIKELISWFDRRTFNVVKRKYHLSYSSVVFDFDVSIEVNLVDKNGILVPVYNSYDGYWDIPFRKPEVIKFTMDFTDFITE